MSDIRITSGIYCNRKIRVPNLRGLVRPTKVRTRTILFDIIMQYLPENFSFMDVCAGYGVVGIEALSRGASLLVFCEINKKCIDSIKENLQLMPKITADTMFLNKSALKIGDGRCMDAVFIDPPYASSHNIIYDIIYRLQSRNWIGEDTLIIFETSNEKEFLSNDKIDILRQEKIGNTMLYFARFIIPNIESLVSDIISC